MTLDSFAVILTIVIVLLGVLAYNCISNILGLSKDLETPKLEPCRRHEWYSIHDQDGNDLGLVCVVCSKTPNLLESEE